MQLKNLTKKVIFFTFADGSFQPFLKVKDMYILSASEKVLLFVCGFGILQGILLSVLIYFHPRSDRSVNKFLALYILAVSAVMTMPFAINIIGWQRSLFAPSISLLPGILLYLYIRSFKERITWQRAFPHILLFFIFCLLAAWNLSIMGHKYPDAKQIPIQVLKAPGTQAIMLFRVIQQVLYFFLSRKTLHSYQQSIQNLFSDISRIDLKWGKFLINGYILLICSFLVIFPLMLHYPQHFNVLLLLNLGVATPYLYIASYKGMMQPTIWQLQHKQPNESIQGEIPAMEAIEKVEAVQELPKAPKTGLTEGRMVEMVDKLTYLMEKEKLYQVSELTLQQLAEKLQLQSYQVSQVINDGMKRNFYDLVNNYRVEEAKKAASGSQKIELYDFVNWL